MAEEFISVALVEDDRDVRELLQLIIEDSAGFVCEHGFADGEQAVREIVKTPPDVVLMDIDLPGMSGIECVRRLKDKLTDTDFIMLTIKEDNDSVFESICAGATGYLLKDMPPNRLLEAIREVYNGGSPMSASIARKVVSSFKRSKTSPLTSRETEILQKLCDGDNYKTIAESLFISGDTVRSHIKNIYRKLHVSSRAAMVKKAIRNGLV